MDDTRQRNKKGNKENAEPANRVQSFIKNEPTAQFHQKTIRKSPTVASKQSDGKGTSDQTLKNAKQSQRGRQLTAENDQTYRQAFLTEQKAKKVLGEFSKPPLSGVAPKPTPGLYKGKVIESKIACIWKLSSTVERPQAKSSMLKPKDAESGSLEKRIKPKSVFEPRSTIHSRNRFTMGTAEERRAKLAGWQASKVKSLKRPAMKTAQTKVFETQRSDLKSQSEPGTQHEPEDSLKAQEKVLPAAHYGARSWRVDLTPPNQSLVQPQENMDDLIVNLSALMESMMASPKREDESAPVTNVSNNAELDDGKPKDECREGLKNEPKEDIGDKSMAAQVKIEKESKDQKMVMDGEMESKNEFVMEAMPQSKDTSMVKYSVTTTPYLQRVKKTIDDASSASKRKGNIKDLKFLTPVRRSCRIQRKSSHLPSMLQDHDPCVISLAELVNLDDSPNAFIYRKNAALTEYMSDLPPLGSVHEN